MKMIKAIVRPEKCDEVLNELCEAGFRATTRYGILGRGKQRGLKVSDVYYDEIPKELIMLVVEDENVNKVTDLLLSIQEQVMAVHLVMVRFSFYR